MRADPGPAALLYYHIIGGINMIENLRYSGYHPDYVRGFEAAEDFVKLEAAPVGSYCVDMIKQEIKMFVAAFGGDPRPGISIIGYIDGLQYFANLLQLEALYE
jgi:hypothetical protein